MVSGNALAGASGLYQAVRDPSVKRGSSRDRLRHGHRHSPGGRSRARRLPERVAETRRHHAHTARRSPLLSHHRARSHAASRSRGQERSAGGPHPSGHGRQAERGPHRIHRRARAGAKRERAASAGHAIWHEAAESPGVRDQGTATGLRHRCGRSRSITTQRSSGEIALRPGRPGRRDQETSDEECQREVRPRCHSHVSSFPVAAQ